ncbi:MAG: AAA-like domain-containing protein [Cyanobacteria bacterium P01_H01_bin.26]
MAGSIYTTGGTVQAGGGIYLSRKADDELLQLCREGQFAYVLTSRQMGKSSLMVQTAARLEDEDITSVIVDLTKIGTNVTPEQWYLGLLTEIDESLMLDTDIFDWWEENSHLGVTQRLTRFFEEILLGEVDGRIVLFVDEIDTTLSLGFTDDFFIAIRYFYTARAQNSDLGRLSVVLIGVASPGDLISDPQRTPFNVGRRVNLTDFSREEAQGFAAGLSESPDKAQEILQWVMQWTGGHPYLTQRLCQGVVESERTEWSAAAVERLVEDLFLTAGVRNDNNLLFVRDMLVRRTPDENGSVYEVLTTYSEIWRERELVLDEEQSLIKSHLKLAGVVRRDEMKGSLYVSNEIYRGVFDQGWVKEHLPVNWVKRLQRQRALIGALSAIILLAVPLAVLAELQRGRAIKGELEAQSQREEAEKQTKIAQGQQKAAEEQELIAKTNKDLAEEKAEEAEQARENEASQRQAAENARLAETQQRTLAETREREANEQKALAEQQTLVAQEQTILAQANGSKALLLANQPLQGIQAAVNSWQTIQAKKIQDPNVILLAQTALMQGVYNNKAFNLNNPNIQENPYPLQGFLEKNQLKSHSSIVRSVAFSHSGETIASASADQTVKLWDRNGHLLTTLEGHDGWVSSVAFSPDEQTIASASDDQTVKLWDRNGHLLTTLEGHDGWVRSVAFSPDGQTIASASTDRTVKLWDRNGDLLKTLEGHDGWVRSVAFSPDGQTIVSASDDQTVKLWNRDGTLLITLKGHSARVWSVAFSPGGETLASASADQTVKLWDRNGSLIETLEGHSATVWSVAFSSDGQTLASASDDQTVKLWDHGSLLDHLGGYEGRVNRSGDYEGRINIPLLNTMEGHTATVRSVAFSPGGETLASASDDQSVKLWDRNGSPLTTLESHNAAVSSIVFSPDSQILASASEDKTVKLWDRNGTPLNTLEGHTATVSSVAFSPNGQTLASASEDQTVKLWDRNGTPLTTLAGHIATVSSVVFSPDGQTIASASADRTVKLWDRNGTPLNTLEGHSDWVRSVAFSPDGQTLASASDDQTVKLWDRNGNLIETLEGHNARVWSIAFSSDGQTLASASDDQTVKLWDRDGNPVETLEGHNATVWSIAFSPDGQTLASASDDQTVKLWDRDGNLLTTLEGHGSTVRSVAFSLNGQTLASAGGDQTVKLWDRNPETLMAWSCNWLRDYLLHNPNGIEAAEEGVCRDYLPRSATSRDTFFGRFIDWLTG